MPVKLSKVKQDADLRYSGFVYLALDIWGSGAAAGDLMLCDVLATGLKDGVPA